MTTTPPVRRRAGTWRGLLLLAVAVDLVLLVAQGAARQDWEALAVAAALLIGALLLRFRSGLAGLVVLTLSFANLVLWMLPAAISNAGHRQGVVGLLLPASLAAVSLAGLVAGLASIARRRQPAAGGAAVVPAALGAVGVVAAVLGVAAVTGPGPGSVGPGGALALKASKVAFQPASLTAPSGQVTVDLTNQDLFWHSFTMDRPAVNLDVPVGGERRLTFSAGPGSYAFYCRVPGHRQAGMVGTLRVG
jgi:uncharacterized cupredoxin-like copper-binding protein